MAIRNILTDNDPLLRKKSREVTVFDERLHVLLDDMAETMLNANGLGLAAPQVGILRRVCVVLKLAENEGGADEIIELINPKIEFASKEVVSGSEGCLSFPDQYDTVERPKKVKVSAQDRNGNPFEVEGEDLLARAFCHEIDHLDGILFKDRVKKPSTQKR